METLKTVQVEDEKNKIVTQSGDSSHAAPSGKKNQVRKLIFYVTNRCNYKCAHCFYWDSLNIKDVLSFEEIKKIVDGVGELDTLLIAGGEPFLRRDLAEICEYFIDKSHVRLLSIPTNGSLHEATIDFVKRMHTKCKLRIYVSLDGMKGMHEAIRGIPGAFEKAIDLLKTLVEMQKEYKVTPMAMFVVNNQNYDQIDEMAKLMNEIGVQYSMTPLRGAPKDGTLRPPTSAEWKTLTDNLQKKRNFVSLPNTSLIKKLYQRLYAASKTKMYMDALDGNRNYVCDAGENTGVIDYEGQVFFCELTKPVGNIKDFNYDFDKLWFSARAEAYRPEIQTCVCTHACFIQSRFMRSAEWMSRSLS